jgi:hypothetical protein
VQVAIMTADDFRRLALSFPETEERAHMDHPDFRVRGVIFATLGYPDKDHGMVKLFPDQQQEFIRESPHIFWAKGGWGEKGATLVRLKVAEESAVRKAMSAAWRNWAPKKLTEGPDEIDKQPSASLKRAASAKPARARAKSSRPGPRRPGHPR